MGYAFFLVECLVIGIATLVLLVYILFADDREKFKKPCIVCAMICTIAILVLSSVGFTRHYDTGKPLGDFRPGEYALVLVAENEYDGHQYLDMLVRIDGNKNNEDNNANNTLYFRLDSLGLRGDIPSLNDATSYKLVIEQKDWKSYHFEPK